MPRPLLKHCSILCCNLYLLERVQKEGFSAQNRMIFSEHLDNSKGLEKKNTHRSAMAER